MDRITDRPDMTSAVDCGRKTSAQTNKQDFQYVRTILQLLNSPTFHQRLGKRELICLLLFTCNYVVFVWRGILFLWVLGMGYVILLWHSLSLPYNYFVGTIFSYLQNIPNRILQLHFDFLRRQRFCQDTDHRFLLLTHICVQ